MNFDENGVVRTRKTLKSIWSGVKSYATNAAIDGYKEKGIRTVFKENLVNDFKCIAKRKFSKENNILVNLFSKDKQTSARAVESIKSNIRAKYTLNFDVSSVEGNFSKFYKILKVNKDVFKNYKGILENVEKISTGTFDVKDYVGKKAFSYVDEYQGASLSADLGKNIKKTEKAFNTFRSNLETGIGWAF